MTEQWTESVGVDNSDKKTKTEAVNECELVVWQDETMKQTADEGGSRLSRVA